MAVCSVLDACRIPVFKYRRLVLVVFARKPSTNVRIVPTEVRHFLIFKRRTYMHFLEFTQVCINICII